MRRGEIWTSSGGGDYAGKPRPVVIVQRDAFSDSNSVTVCPLSSSLREAPIFRVVVEPTEPSGLDRTSSIMADRITTVRRERLHTRVRELAAPDIIRLERAIAAFLGLARQP